MGVAPRSEAIEKYAMDAVVRTIKANWWNTRVPLGLCIPCYELRDPRESYGRTNQNVEDDDTKERRSEDTKRSPQPVRAIGGQVQLSVRGVEVECFVTGH